MIDFDRDFTMTINGKEEKGASTFGVENPATGIMFAQAPDCSAQQLDDAVSAARAAFPSWRATPIAKRQEMVMAAAAKIGEYREGLKSLLTREQGKPISEAGADVMSGAYWCKVFSRMELPVKVTEDSDSRRVEVRHTPIGVVGALAAWNYPMLLAMMKSAPALVAGNTVVLKPSPFTPLTTLKLGELLRDVLPPGVFNVVSGGDHLGPLMTAHPGIDKITFTGSSATGRKVMRSASDTVKRVTLELGGNDAAIVMPDVDVDLVAEEVFAGAFGNTGQMCVAIKRLYVHAEIYDRFANALVNLVRSATVGDGAEQGTKFGPVQNKQQYLRIKDLIHDAKANGYNFLIGGDDIDRPGYFIPLTIIDNPPDNSRIVKEEQFGPVLPILKFHDVDDVVRRANDTPYGLGGQVWSGDAEKALDIASRLDTGNIFINQTPMLFAHSPFGGHKSSGFGVECGLDGLIAFTNLQTVAVNKRPVAKVPA